MKTLPECRLRCEEEKDEKEGGQQEECPDSADETKGQSGEKMADLTAQADPGVEFQGCQGSESDTEQKPQG